MTLGIFVEGPSDKQTIPVLLNKLGQTSASARVMPQGDMLDAVKMEAQIKAFKDTQPCLAAVLIFIDSEGVDPSNTYERTRGPLAVLSDRIRRPLIDYVVVDHSLEGWLACDEDAVRQVIGRQARVKFPGSPDNHRNPAQLM